MHRLYALLDAYNSAAPDGRPAVEDRIWAQLGRQRAPLILDMSGFSMTTRTRGLIHYLAMVRRMHHIAGPLVIAHGGARVKFEADNLFAVFDQVRDAVAAAQTIQRAFREETVPEGKDRIRVSIGIGWGRLIEIPEKDFFGDCVNTAAKLGEDLARGGETLLTREAYEALPDGHGFALERQAFSISGLDLEAWRLLAD
jgi:class 3 adenylate cyclase